MKAQSDDTFKKINNEIITKQYYEITATSKFRESD